MECCNNGNNSIIFLIILIFLFGNGDCGCTSLANSCGSGCPSNGCGCGGIFGGDNAYLILLLILFCGCR